jgi:hypothetical protein
MPFDRVGASPSSGRRRSACAQRLHPESIWNEWRTAASKSGRTSWPLDRPRGHAPQSERPAGHARALLALKRPTRGLVKVRQGASSRVRARRRRSRPPATSTLPPAQGTERKRKALEQGTDNFSSFRALPTPGSPTSATNWRATTARRRGRLAAREEATPNLFLAGITCSCGQIKTEVHNVRPPLGLRPHALDR